VYYDERPGKTDNFIQEIDDFGCEINKGFEGKYTYLFPKWGGEEDALCGIGFAKFKKAQQGGSDLAKGAGGDYRYLQFRKNGKEGIKKGNIFLWRTHKDIHQSNPAERGYEYGDDINSGRDGGGHLYLCWKTCPIGNQLKFVDFKECDSVLFDMSNGGSNAIKRTVTYSHGVDASSTKEYGLNMGQSFKSDAKIGSEWLGGEVSAQAAKSLSQSVKDTIQSSSHSSKQVVTEYTVAPKKRLLVTQKKVTVTMQNGGQFEVASNKICIKEFDV